MSTPDLKARNEHGGVSLVGKYDVGGGEFTSVTAWRYWDWGPANDRDFTGLPITPQSQNPTKQNQYTQEFRYAYETERYDYVVGAFGFYQKIHTQGTESQGPAASRWSLNPGNVPVGSAGCATPTTLACIPAVLNRLTAANDILLKNTSVALFGKLNWNFTDRLTVSRGCGSTTTRSPATTNPSSPARRLTARGSWCCSQAPTPTTPGSSPSGACARRSSTNPSSRSGTCPTT